MIEKIFKLKDRQTSVKTELLAGLTTYLTMAYVIFVIPSTLAATGMDKNALIAATCLIAALSTAIMAFVANVPIALAPGLGLNAFFTYTLVITYGVSWHVALGIVFWAGIIFILLSLFGAREKIIATIPKSIVAAIPVGIGLFLLFIGFKNLGIIVGNPATLVMLGKFNMQLVIGLAGLFVTVILQIKKIKGAILFGIVLATLAGIIFGHVASPHTVFSSVINIEPVVLKLDILGALKWNLIGPIFALFYINMFDTLGTLVACATEAGLVQKDGKIKNIGRMLTVDATATILSSLIGTSPTGAYIESATGIAEGGKTGLTAFFTSLLFLLSLVFIPVIGIVPAYATAPPLIIVGILMVGQIRNINFDSYEEFIPSIFTIILMPLSFSISTGMACGFLTWGIIKIMLFKFKEISFVMYLIMALSLISLLL
jgi:AGZA family xanthine/uracil permease-like MFS transporter